MYNSNQLLVIKEMVDNDIRLFELDINIKSGSFAAKPLGERGLLRKQAFIMAALSDVLRARIHLFEVKQ